MKRSYERSPGRMARPKCRLRCGTARVTRRGPSVPLCVHATALAVTLAHGGQTSRASARRRHDQWQSAGASDCVGVAREDARTAGSGGMPCRCVVLSESQDNYWTSPHLSFKISTSFRSRKYSPCAPTPRRHSRSQQPLHALGRAETSPLGNGITPGQRDAAGPA